jgi:molybdenum cofactor synthesis domain-containing protein
MAEPGKTVTACLIVIGNEILSGRTQDKNISFLAARLNEIGVGLREVRVIPDVTETIVRTVNECRSAFDYVFTTGGIGPTHDDITSDSVAQAFGVKNVLNEHARRILFDHYGDENVNEARLRMAHMPEGAELIENPISKAPGYQIENVFVLAGVPSIMRAMFESLRHRLVGGAPVRSRTISAGLPEGRIATAFGKLQDAFADVEMGSYPYFRDGIAGCSLVLRSTDEGRLAQATEKLRALVREAGGEPVDEVTG